MEISFSLRNKPYKLIVDKLKPGLEIYKFSISLFDKIFYEVHFNPQDFTVPHSGRNTSMGENKILLLLISRMDDLYFSNEFIRSLKHQIE